MLHSKFQEHRTLGSEEKRFLKVLAIYGHGGHLGHVTKIIFRKFMFSLAKEAPHKSWP